MREYRNWRKLFVGTNYIASLLLVGCDENTDQYDVPMPHVLTVDQLAAEYEDFIGRPVVLEGFMFLSEDGRYYLTEKSQSDTTSGGTKFRISMHFGFGPPNDERMTKCLVETVLVTGEVAESKVVQVEIVKLKSDALKHGPDSCYQYFD